MGVRSRVKRYIVINQDLVGSILQGIIRTGDRLYSEDIKTSDPFVSYPMVVSTGYILSNSTRSIPFVLVLVTMKGRMYQVS